MVSRSGVAGSHLFGRVSQVPRFISPRALSPLTPESPAGAHTLCFPSGGGLHPIRKAGHSHWCNEAVMGSLALRLTRLPLRGSDQRIAPTGRPGDYLCERAIHRASTLQLAR